MKKRLTSFIFVLALSFSLFSVSASAEFTNTDSRTLTDIYKIIQYLHLSPASWQSNSVIGFLERILNAIPSNLSTNFALRGGDGTNAILDDVRKWTMFTYNSLTSSDIAGNLGDIQRNTLATADRITNSNTLLGNISDSVSGINGYATEGTLSALADVFYSDPLLRKFKTDAPIFLGKDKFSAARVSGSYASFASLLFQNLTQDTYFGSSDLQWGPSLYSLVHILQETLASEGDRQLAENNKENRDEVEKDFLGGQSGPTSLGKGDFSNASQVGGALNDTFNMGGASKVSDFVSGFGSAGQESLSWFSDTTANNLDSVTVAGNSTSGVSTFSDDGESMVDVDPDPYNMSEIVERYEWLEGVLG